jgi:hypothetical protein
MRASLNGKTNAHDFARAKKIAGHAGDFFIYIVCACAAQA